MSLNSPSKVEIKKSERRIQYLIQLSLYRETNKHTGDATRSQFKLTSRSHSEPPGATNNQKLLQGTIQHRQQEPAGAITSQQ